MMRMTVREGGTVRSVRLEGTRVEVGNGPASGLRLAGAGVSHRHCLLRGLRRGFEVLDQDSAEGTILNGTRVSRAALAPGDVLTVGSASVVIDELVADLAPGHRRWDEPRAPAPEVPPLTPRAAGPSAPDPFEIQLYRAVRRSPPLLGSAGFHAAVALAALLLVPDPRAAPPGPATVHVVRDFAVETEDSPRLPLAAEELPAEDEPVVPDPAAPLPHAAPPPPKDREVPPPSPAVTRGGDVADGMITVGGRRRADPDRKATLPENRSFGADGSGDANRAAAGLVLEGLGSRGSAERTLLAKLDARRVLVVKGTYDRVEDTLALLGIRHDTLTPEEVAVAPLSPQAILVIDCDADPLPPEACKAVRAFVHAGGYLCTTDWGLENVLEKSFPGMLRSLARGGMGVSTQNEVVPMRVTSPGHPLVRGIRAVSEDASWWVEDQAHPVEVLDKEHVTVLAESPEFRKRWRSGVLAATFPFGKGKVLHLLGHAWQKEGNLRGTYALQRMILNFFVDRAATME